MPGPFDDLIPSQPAQPATPGIIRGQPKPVDPFKVSAEQRAQEDQAFQREKFEVERQKTALDMQKTQRDLAPGADTTEAEKTAGFLATRVAGGLRELSRITKAKPDAAKPSFGIEATRSIFGDTAANYLTDADRQQVVAAQTDILDAALTLGTGAAYTAEQLTGYRQSYFPQLGDDDATVKAKQARLLQLLESAKVKAGRASPQIEQALAAVQGDIAADGTGNPAEEALKAKYPEAVEFQYDKNGELLGFYNKDDEFTLLFGPGGNQQPPTDGGGGGLGQALYAGVGDVAEGIGNVAGIIGNPLNAGINAIAGTNLSTDLGQTFRDATGAPQGNALASAINQGGVGAMTGAGLANAAARGGGGYIANALASQPVQQVAGGITAGAAAEGARQSGASAPVQLGAGLLGGVLGFGGANALMTAARPTSVAPVAQAAARQGVDLLPAQTGGTATRIATAGGRQGIVSEIPIAKAVEKQAGQLENVRGRASSSVGNALDKEDAGDLVRKAANIYSKKTGETGGALYTRAYNRAGNTKAALPEAVKIAETEMAKIAQAPGGKDTALYKELAALKKNMEGGKFSIEGIRSMRTTLREEADFKGIRGTNSTRIYGEIINAASDDMAKALKAAGKEDAASAFKTADDFWKARVETIDEVLDPVLGKNTARSGEQIVSALERMANRETGDASKLRRLMNAMPENEARNVRATVIERLGKPSAGQETDSAFSLAKFLTDYNNMSGKAKSILFTGESRKALDDLAEIARADKNAGKLLNSSNTARAVGVQAGVSGLAAWFINPIAAAAIGAGQFAFGKLLASPKFANWLAKVPANPQAQAAHVKRLDSIAAAEPVIANDIASIKQAVQQYLDGAPGLSQAAASDQVGEERPIQP